MAFGDFFYYALLKHGKIIIVVLGVIIAIMAYTYAQKFGIGFASTTDSSVKYCEEDMDCFEHCGKCVSIASTEVCEPDFSIKCVCSSNQCTIA